MGEPETTIQGRNYKRPKLHKRLRDPLIDRLRGIAVVLMVGAAVLGTVAGTVMATVLVKAGG